jgi:hypothetical protein
MILWLASKYQINDTYMSAFLSSLNLRYTIVQAYTNTFKSLRFSCFQIKLKILDHVITSLPTQNTSKLQSNATSQRLSDVPKLFSAL